MRTTIAILAAALAGGLLPPAAGAAQHTPRKAVVAAVDAWPGAWERRDGDAICGLFARDAVLVFQGRPDRDYATACAQFRRLAADPDTEVHYRRPQIQSVAVSGRLAAVRLIWTVTIRSADGTTETSREQGLDVLRRGADGRWRITVSHAYPLE
jgi:uncharacterized protein (TIGR02246 family)